ncbi:MAG: head GIN domain-containing protein [Pseudoalteromonas distincta]
MNIQISTTFAAAMLFVTSAALAETRSFDLSTFDEIHVFSGIKAEIVVGGDQSVVVEAESDDDFDKLEISVRNGKLSIGLDRGLFGGWRGLFSKGPDITAFVTVPILTGLDGSSGAGVQAKGMSGQYLTVEASSGASITVEEISGEDISVSASSGAVIDASGTCGHLGGEVSSGGNLDLARLECKDVRVDASSGGNASVFASVSINADASSGSNIDVAGGPDDIEIDVTSGGDIDFNN